MSESDKPQLDKFRDLARELEADEDEARFEEAVNRIARKTPADDALLEESRAALAKSQELLRKTKPD